MPDTKLPALPAVTSAADDDLIYMVDTSDTTDDPTGTSVGIRKDDLFTGIVAGGGGIGNASRILIQEIELTSAGEFDFDNIPAGYDRLIIEGMVRSDAAGLDNDVVVCYMNADLTNGNYFYQIVGADNGIVILGEAAQPVVGQITAATSPANVYGQIRLDIEDYAGTHGKMVQAFSCNPFDATHVRRMSTSVATSITAVITRLRIRTDNHPTDQLLGKLQLIGEKVSPAVAPGVTTTITAKVPLETITNGTAAEFDFDNIPAGYDKLIIEGTLRSDNTSASDNANCYINDDLTDTNYHIQNMRAVNGASVVGESAVPSFGTVAGAGATSGYYSSVEIRLEDVGGSNSKTFSSFFTTPRSNSDVYIGQYGGVSAITAAITRLRIRTDNHPTDQLLGELTLYGEKEIPIPVDTGGRTLIEEITNVTAGEFDFDNIPQGYKRLIIQGSVKSDESGQADEPLRVWVNGDTTTTNYYSQAQYALNGASVDTEFNASWVCNAPAGSAPAGSRVNIEVKLEEYSVAGILKAIRSSFVGYEGVGILRTGEVACINKLITVPVTRLQIQTDGHATTGMTGTLSLYGEH